MRLALSTVLALAICSHPVVGGERGIASRYCQLTKTASGRTVSCRDLVAAHRRLPFGKRVKVTNLSNGKSVIVTIVDRGPFVRGRIIDLSEGAASRIGSAGLMRVELTLEW